MTRDVQRVPQGQGLKFTIGEMLKKYIIGQTFGYITIGHQASIYLITCLIRPILKDILCNSDILSVFSQESLINKK